MWEQKQDIALNTINTKRIEILNSSGKKEITARIYPIDPSEYRLNVFGDIQGIAHNTLVVIDPILEYHNLSATIQ